MGINMNDAFPSKWLKADDVPGKVRVTINHVSMEDVGDDHKPVVWFNEYQKGVVLNKTNAGNISALYGPDTDAWIGKPMDLTTAWVDFQGRSTKSLRLYAPESFASGTQGSVSVQSGGQSHHVGGDPRGDVPPPSGEGDYGAVRG